jgi:hypothetical protein
VNRLWFRHGNGTGVAFHLVQRRCRRKKEQFMDLAIWIPAMLLLGLAGLGLMCAFIIGCEKV